MLDLLAHTMTVTSIVRATEIELRIAQMDMLLAPKVCGYSLHFVVDQGDLVVLNMQQSFDQLLNHHLLLQ